MEARSITVDTRPSIIDPGRRETLIIPIGDVQLGPNLRGRPRAAHLDRLKRVVEWGAAHGAYWVGMGDMADVASPSNRAELKASRLYDNVHNALEEQAFQVLEELEEVFAPTRGRWLGMVQGHHYHQFEDGGTTDTKLAEYVGCQFLGDTGYLQVNWVAEGHKATPSIKMFVWHGQGSSTTVAGALNKLEKKIGDFEADAYLMGHYHRAGHIKKERLDIIGGTRGGEPKLVHKDKLLVATGSFMRAYMQGSRREGRPGGGYVEVAGMSPAALGTVVIFAQPRNVGDGYVTVDLDALSR